MINKHFISLNCLILLLNACGNSLSPTSTEKSDPSQSELLIISGGGTPAGNHHSQYLQTKALYEHLFDERAFSNTTIFFGTGNRPDKNPTIADVHQTKNIDDKNVHIMLAGSIKNNNQANKSNVLNHLKNVSNQNTKPFFLLVSDHGMPNEEDDPDYTNNCIDLWGFDEIEKTSKSFQERCLSRKELQDHLPEGRQTVFAMSQCFSGGFHRMSVETLSGRGLVRANPAVCGFTASTPDLTASGCTPDADGPGYKGYERYFTQQITGRNFITGQALSTGKQNTMREAHLAASLEDFTIDIPMSTSDFYLNEWSNLIHKKTATELYKNKHECGQIS